MNVDLTSTFEKFGFMGLGVFTTCCYTNDFTPIDLLRIPQTFRAHINRNMAIFHLPNWFPQDHGILEVGNGRLYSRLRDIPLIKRVKPSGDKHKDLIIQLPETIGNIEQATLTYWPLFRFAHTGKPFAIKGHTALFACQVIEYASRRSGFSVSKIDAAGEIAELKISTTDTALYFIAAGRGRLRNISLSMGEYSLALDLENRRLILSDVLTPNLTAAARTMQSGGNSLRNCKIDSSHANQIILQYEGASRV